MNMLDFKRLRKQLGFSLSEMAQALGLEGDGGSEEVRNYENGNKEIPSTVARLYLYLNQSVPDEYQVIPKFITGSCLAQMSRGNNGEETQEIIYHTQFPRFLAHAFDFDTPVPEEFTTIRVDILEKLVVTMWIDDPMINQTRSIKAVEEAAHFLREWNKKV